MKIMELCGDGPFAGQSIDTIRTIDGRRLAWTLALP